ALRRFAPEHAEVVTARMRERRRQEERGAAASQDAGGHDGLATRPVEHEICGGKCQADEHSTVEVGPERNERYEEPYPPSRCAGLSAEQKQCDAEQHEREELCADDDERRNAGEKDHYE